MGSAPWKIEPISLPTADPAAPRAREPAGPRTEPIIEPIVPSIAPSILPTLVVCPGVTVPESKASICGVSAAKSLCVCAADCVGGGASICPPRCANGEKRVPGSAASCPGGNDPTGGGGATLKP